MILLRLKFQNKFLRLSVLCCCVFTSSFLLFVAFLPYPQNWKKNKNRWMIGLIIIKYADPMEPKILSIITQSYSHWVCRLCKKGKAALLSLSSHSSLHSMTKEVNYVQINLGKIIEVIMKLVCWILHKRTELDSGFILFSFSAFGLRLRLVPRKVDVLLG